MRQDDCPIHSHKEVPKVAESFNRSSMDNRDTPEETLHGEMDLND
jgi:hypothetical protein